MWQKKNFKKTISHSTPLSDYISNDMISSINIENNDIAWCNVDTVQILLLDKNVNCFILNTDMSTGEGIHWLTCKKIPPNIIYIYDSLGKNNYRKYDDIMIEKIKKCNYKTYIYDNQSQYISSNWCGWYAILCVKYLEPCKSIQECNQTINYLFDNDKQPTLKDEYTVLSHFGLTKK